MSNPINRKTIYLDDALEAIRKLPNAGIHWFISAEAVFDALLQLPSAQPDLQPTCNQLATVAKDICVPCKDSISRQSAIDAILHLTNFESIRTLYEYTQEHVTEHWTEGINDAIDAVIDVPSAQPDIIRCNACKHWTQTTGNMPGFGLGDCDYLNAKLVSCNGFCYWAERRIDGRD